MSKLFQRVGYCFAPNYWGSAITRVTSCVKLLGNRVLLCVKLLGNRMRKVLLCIKLLGNYNLLVFALCQAIQAIGGLQFLMYLKHALMARDRFIIDPISSCTVKTPFHVAILAHLIRRPLLGQRH